MRTAFRIASTFAALAALAAIPARAGPNVVVVDAPGDVGRHPSVQLNASGFPVISYADITNDALKLAVCGDARCTTSTLTSIPSGATPGQFTSLQFNASGFPVVSYFGGNGDLQLAVCGDATCTTRTISTVDSAGTVGTYSSLQLNASGFPVIAYWDGTQADLRVAVCQDATCNARTLTTVDSTGVVGQFASLQLNASGFPVVSYSDNTNRDLKVAVCGDATCITRTITTVDSAGNVGDFTSLQLNASGFPVISYLDGTNGDLKLAVCGDATCSTSTITAVDTAGVVGQDTSLRLNANGFPVIAYRDGSNSDLKLAVCGDATCTTRTTATVDSVGLTGFFNSLQLDGAGLPVIAYYDSTNGNLKLATFVPAAVTSVSVPANGAYITGQDLDFTVNWSEAITVTGTPSIALTIGATTRQATYLSGSGTSAIVFRYTVVAGDNDEDGIAVGALALNGGTKRDAFSVDANLTLNSVGGTAGVLVNPFVAVTTFTGPSATGTGTINASFTGGGAGCTFTLAQFIPVSGHAASPPAGTAPAVFPHGLFDFRLGGCTPGSTIAMTVTYPSALPAGTQYWKYGPTPANPVPHWYVLPATIAGATATFSITDGALGDDDLAANGAIIDQGGPGVGAGAGSSTAVPTLSHGMLALLSLLMLALVARQRGVPPHRLVPGKRRRSP